MSKSKTTSKTATTQNSAATATAPDSTSDQKDSAGERAPAAEASPKKSKTVEFRFHCTPSLRERMNDRLKALGLERGQIMVQFLEEWLKQTESYLQSQKPPASSSTDTASTSA